MYILFPFFILLSGVVAEYSGLDLALVSPFYSFPLHTWPLKAHWLTSQLLHKDGRLLVDLMALLIFIVFVLSFFVERFKSYRKGAGYLLVASLLGPALVAIGKDATHIYSPWDLQLFNGTQPYIRLFDHVPEGARVGHAFPAGHSSSGFALFSLFFLAKEYKPHLQIHALLVTLLIGFSFGLAQQMRGAHFLSHDLFSLAICWISALFMYLVFFRNQAFLSWVSTSPKEQRARQ